MRVIAGTAGGIRLEVPETEVRPTMDRVKAAIFSSLGEAVADTRVLDLFAGTGALGIEALSRGAASAMFVDEKRDAIQAVEKNLARTGFTGTVRQRDVFEFLESTAAGRLEFDLIFADPPYEKMRSGEAFTDLLLHDANLARLLARDGTFILEKRPGEELPSADLWEVLRAKAYGATEVLFLRHARAAAEIPEAD